MTEDMDDARSQIAALREQVARTDRLAPVIVARSWRIYGEIERAQRSLSGRRK